MKRSRYTETQIVKILKEVEAGISIPFNSANGDRLEEQLNAIVLTYADRIRDFNSYIPAVTD